MKRLPRRAGLALTLAATLSAAIGLTIANGSAVPPTGLPVASQPPTLPTASVVDPAISGHLALFRQAAASPRADVAALGAVEHSRATQHFGLQDTLARKALTSSLGHAIYVVPGNGWICVTGVDVGNSCDPVNQLDTAAPQLSVAQCGPIPQGQIALSGIAPDEISELAVLRGGQQTPITITNNVFFALVPVGPDVGVPDALRWKDPSGAARSLSLQLPPLTATAQCARESAP